MVVTTEQAAEQAGVEPVTIRQWVSRGYLSPLRPGAHPLTFRYDDVARCQRDRRSARWLRTLETARQKWGATG